MVRHQVRLDATDDGDLLVGPFLVRLMAPADDRDDEYRLRHDVFVEERGFLPPGPVRLRERDEFDSASCAMLLYDATTGRPAACQRLILPDRLLLGLRTNLEQEYRPLPTGPSVDFGALGRDSWAEASRTTVAPPFRWGASTADVPAMAVIKLASIALAVALDRRVLFSMSEPATARLIRRLGFPMVQVGAVVDYHGRRAPFRMDVGTMEASVAATDASALRNLMLSARRVRARLPHVASVSGRAR